MQTNIDFIRGKAIEILNTLSDSEIEKQFSSALKDSQGSCTIMHVKTGKLFPRYVRNISISDEFATQVFYRHSLRKISGVLSTYAHSTIDQVQKSRAEEYINIYKNVENVYNNRKDDETFDELVAKSTHIIISSIEFTKETKTCIPHRYFVPLEVTSILTIKSLPEIKAKRLEMASNRIKNYTMKKDV